jgi:hypothetical protein
VLDGKLDRAKRLYNNRPWVAGHASLLLRQIYDRRRNARQSYTDQDHLACAAQWLEAAQDAASDGGVAGRYRLDRGWTSSYPETTGYIIPTFLALSRSLGAPRFTERAARCIQFLLSVQLESGAFPGLEIAENRTVPSPFNTAQILHGLLAWHRETGAPAALEAAHRAAQWLMSVQDADGAWRRYYYLDTPTTYSAHLSCWLAEYGAYANDQAALAAAGRHLDWVLQQQQPNGWFRLAGFNAAQHAANVAFTHTIAYTIWGVLLLGEILGRADAIDAARRAAHAAARRLELSRGLPGLLDGDWKARGPFCCLTGNAQMALIWFKLHGIRDDLPLVSAGLKAIDEVKLAQPMVSTNAGILGGVPGSDPIDGEYIRGAIPNWAAKFFIDALHEKRRVLEMVEQRAAPLRDDPPPAVVSTRPPAGDHVGDQRVVLLTSPRSRKVADMLDAWRFLDPKHVVVVAERLPEPPALKRLQSRLRDVGAGELLARRFDQGRTPSPAGADVPAADVFAYCQSMGVRIVETGPLDAPASVAAVEALRPDVLIHAGASILRAATIKLPRLGVLNAHMGLLPAYRGVNVVEWACLNGDPVGCSVHLIDTGIDTGAVLATRAVSTAGCRDIAALRAVVDAAQIELLGSVLAEVLRTGSLPPATPNNPAEGRQYFSMHPTLKAVLERMLSGRQSHPERQAASAAR